MEVINDLPAEEYVSLSKFAERKLANAALDLSSLDYKIRLLDNLMQLSK